MGKEQIFAENRAVFGGDNRGHRHAGQRLQLLQQRLMQGKRHQPGARRQHFQAKLFGNLIAKRGSAQPRHRQPAAGDHQLRGTARFRHSAAACSPGRHALRSSTSLRRRCVTTSPFSHSATSISTICCAESSQNSCPSVFSCQAIPCLPTRSIKSHWV